MEKYRLISRWTSDYCPRGYRQDGKPQERVESLNLFSEEEAKHALEYFNKHLTDGAWIAERYEIDDEKYRCFELILPEQAIVIKEEEPIVKEEPLVVRRDNDEVPSPISLVATTEDSKDTTTKVLDIKIINPEIHVVNTEENAEEETPKVPKEKKKRNRATKIEIFNPVKITEVLSTGEVFGPTKTIYVAKYIATQRNLGPDVMKINGRIPSEERAQIYSNFNNNLIEKLSITEAVIRLGGINYEENGKEINIQFLDDIDHHTKEFILNKVNKKF